MKGWKIRSKLMAELFATMATSAVMLFAPANVAALGPAKELCSANGAGSCAIPQNYQTKLNTYVVTQTQNNPIWRWRQDKVGTVTNQFKHQAWNTKYHGKPIVKLVLNANHSACAGLYNHNGTDYVRLVACSDGIGNLWVISGSWLISIRATNGTGNGGAYRQLMTACFNCSNTAVFTGTAGKYQDLAQKWAFI